MKPEIDIVTDAAALYRAGAAEFVRQAREAVGVKGLPGLGVSEEVDESFEHRVCPKCGSFEVRERAM